MDKERSREKKEDASLLTLTCTRSSLITACGGLKNSTFLRSRPARAGVEAGDGAGGFAAAFFFVEAGAVAAAFFAVEAGGAAAAAGEAAGAAAASAAGAGAATCSAGASAVGSSSAIAKGEGGRR